MGTPARWGPTKLRRDAPYNGGLSRWTRLTRGACTWLSSLWGRTRSALRRPKLHPPGVLCGSAPIRRKKLRAARRAAAATTSDVLDVRTPNERERLQ